MKNSSQRALYRLLVILGRLPRHPQKMSVSEIMAVLENEGISISRRVLERDLLSVEAEGFFQIGHDDFKPRGWFWLEEARRMEIPVMDTNSALTFLMTAEYLEKMLPRATLKYLKPYHKRAREVLAAFAGSRYSSWPGKIRVMPRGLQLRPAEIRSQVQEVVYEALLRDRKIRAKYRKVDAARPSEYVLNPLGLVVKDTSVNLVATEDGQDTPHNFLLHRMEEAEFEGGAAVTPRGFSLDRHIGMGELGIKKNERPIRLRMKLLTDYTRRLFTESPIESSQETISCRDGGMVLAAELPDTVVLRSVLLGFGSQIEVLEPASLREELRAEATRVAAIYGAC